MNKKQRQLGAGLARSLAMVGFVVAVLCHTRTAHAQLSPPNYNVLDSWSFYLPDFEDDYGDLPFQYTNVVMLPGPDGDALMVDTNVTAYYNFPILMDGYTNLIVNSGTIIFWINPNWSSTNGGVGPGDEGRFVDVGYYTTNASIGWWSIRTDDGGTNIYFEGQNNAGGQATYICYPISWASNTWVSVAISYSPTNSTLYLNGVTMTNGLGVSYYPDTNILTYGLWFGSDDEGSNLMHGLIAGIETLDTPVNSNVVASLVTQPSIAYDNGTPLTLITSAPSNPGYVPAFDAITGSGNLTLVGSASSCVYGTNDWNVWITNVSPRIVGSRTNATVSVTFTIQGGVSGGTSPFDVFANAALSPSSTNYQWAWEGQGYQCNTYELTNLPTNACFLILGTPHDTSGYGLTDAYEYLVAQVNPYGSQTDSYGVPYAWYAENGLGSQSATNDPDMDGLLNYQEYFYGTHPTVSEGLAIWVGSPNGTTGIP